MKFVTKNVVVGGISVGVLSRRDWAETIVRYCRTNRQDDRLPKTVFAANGNVVALFARDEVFRGCFERADAVTADGQPLVWASRMTRSPIPERAATTDLFHDVAHAAEKACVSFFLFGATERSNAIAEGQIRAKYPELTIVGRRNGYFAPTEESTVLASLRALKPDVLWVGMGAKREVEFVIRNLDALQGVGCIITCGGLFDYFTPEIKRAPSWMQNLSLEWLFRTWQEPKKYLLRYLLTNPVAAFLLLTRTRARLGGRSTNSELRVDS